MMNDEMAALEENMVLFICEHGSAKSVVAAAHFNKLAADHQLPYRAVSRGTDPDDAIHPVAAAGLSRDGLQAPSGTRRLSGNDVRTAAMVVTFFDLPGEFSSMRTVESWRVPAVSENYEAARDEILERVRQIIEVLSAS